MPKESSESRPSGQISREAFAAGMFKIAACWSREITASQFEVFYEILGNRMTDQEWVAVIRTLCESPSQYSPTPGQILEALAEMRDAPFRDGPRTREEREATIARDAEWGDRHRDDSPTDWHSLKRGGVKH